MPNNAAKHLVVPPLPLPVPLALAPTLPPPLPLPLPIRSFVLTINIKTGSEGAGINSGVLPKLRSSAVSSLIIK